MNANILRICLLSAICSLQLVAKDARAQAVSEGYLPENAEAGSGYLPNESEAPQSGYLTDMSRATQSRTLMGPVRTVGVWVQLSNDITRINGSLADVVGAGIGLSLNQTLSFSLQAKGIASWVPADEGVFLVPWNGAPAQRAYLDAGYVGIGAGWEPFGRAVVHPFVTGLIGAGGATYNSRRQSIFAETVYEDPTLDGFFVAEVGGGATVNVARWFRLDVGINGRKIAGLKLPALESREVSGVSAIINLRFGGF